MFKQLADPFVVSWVHDKTLVAIAKKRGAPSDDCILDYASEEDARLEVRAASLEYAFEIAKAKLPEDFFGEVRIAHIVVMDPYGNDMPEEIEDGVWHVYDDTDSLDPDEPDHRPDLDFS